MKLIISTLLVFTYLFSNPLPQKQQEILRLVMSVEGIITEEIHKDFWIDLPQKGLTKKEMSFVEDILLESQKLQKATWESAKLTLAHKEVMKTPELITMSKRFKEKFKHISSYTANLQKIDDFLYKVSNNQPIGRGQNLTYVTNDKIDDVLYGLDSAIERVLLLATYPWDPKIKERVINEDMKVLWHLPLTKSAQYMNINNRKIKQTLYSTYLDNNSLLMFSYIDSRNSDTAKCVEGMTKTMGVDKPLITSSYFNGYKTSTATVKFKSEGEMVFSEVQCLDIKNKLYSLISMGTDVTNANFNANSFLKNLSIKD